MYKYLICNQADKELFDRQCESLEQTLPNLTLVDNLMDVDYSEIRTYKMGEKQIKVINDFDIGYLGIESEFNLDEYFPD